MTTTKKRAPTNGANALAAICELWATGSLAGARVRELGKEYGLQDCIEFAGDSAVVGDNRILGLVLHAVRAKDFAPAANPTHKELEVFADGTWGKGRWRTDRPAWPWERGGSPELDAPFEALDKALADMAEAQDAVWAAREAVSEGRENNFAEAPMTPLVRTLAQAIKAWEKCEEAVSVAKGKVTRLQLRLQDTFRVQQYRRRVEDVPGLTDEVLGASHD